MKNKGSFTPAFVGLSPDKLPMVIAVIVSQGKGLTGCILGVGPVFTRCTEFDQWKGSQLEK